MNALWLAGRLISSWLKPRKPSYLIYFVTARCNARCQMCFYWREMENAEPRTELTPEETEKISQHLPNLIQLTLSGGEPFLREDLFELVKPLIEKARPAFLSIPTNGILTEKISQVTEKICSGFPWLQLNLELSLDGIGETHDQIRGKKGSFEKALASWKELKGIQAKRKNLRLAVLTVLSAYNQEQIFDLLKFIKSELKPDRMEVMLARGETREREAKKVSLEKFQQVSDWLTANSPRQKGILNRFRLKLAEQKRKLIVETVKKDRMLIPCLAGKKLLVMEPDGWVRPCEMLFGVYPNPPLAREINDFRLGNLREADYDLRKILKSEKTQKILNFIQVSQCHCSYECAMLANLVFDPGQLIKLAGRAWQRSDQEKETDRKT